MHFHTEIVVPPGTDIKEAIASIMKPFDENGQDEDGDPYRHTFWDFYVIGGRFAGNKLVAGLDQDKVTEFHDWLRAEKVTVAGLVCGKEELSPASQIPKVDAKWNEMFPHPGGIMVACPLFRHSNDQYGREGDSTIDGDITPLRDCLSVKCCRVIFAKPSYDKDTEEWTGPLEAEFMLTDSIWNGCNHMPVKWDGTIGDALAQYRESLDRYNAEFRSKIEPNDEWLCVTVDYHS